MPTIYGIYTLENHILRNITILTNLLSNITIIGSGLKLSTSNDFLNNSCVNYTITTKFSETIWTLIIILFNKN